MSKVGWVEYISSGLKTEISIGGFLQIGRRRNERCSTAPGKIRYHGYHDVRRTDVFVDDTTAIRRTSRYKLLFKPYTYTVYTV